MIPAGIICEIMKDDGTMARVPDLIEFCRQHEMKMLTVAELIRYRMQHERYVHRVGEAMVETEHGEFRLIAYESEVDGGGSHMALIRGDISDSAEARPGSHARPLPAGRRFWRHRMRLPSDAGSFAEDDCRGRPGRARSTCTRPPKVSRRRKSATSRFLHFIANGVCRRFPKASARFIARSGSERRSFST